MYISMYICTFIYKCWHQFTPHSCLTVRSAMRKCPLPQTSTRHVPATRVATPTAPHDPPSITSQLRRRDVVTVAVAPTATASRRTLCTESPSVSVVIDVCQIFTPQMWPYSPQNNVWSCYDIWCDETGIMGLLAALWIRRQFTDNLFSARRLHGVT